MDMDNDTVMDDDLPFKYCDENELFESCSTKLTTGNQKNIMSSSLLAQNYLSKDVLTINCLGNA